MFPEVFQKNYLHCENGEKTHKRSIRIIFLQTMLNLSVDPSPDVADMARKVVNNVTVKVSSYVKIFC